VSSVEVVEADLRRIGEVNPRLNAVVATRLEERLADAEAAHQARHRMGGRARSRETTTAFPSRRADTAKRALGLIEDGVVDREGVTGLANRLGYSERQLHRIVVAELGAGPLSLARTHRAQSARRLLESTDLTIAQVSQAAGFSSIRQFNDTMREMFGMSPSRLRVATNRAA
jgi:AraC family transcriptional regulator, regulatory protein of adaptative response / DNA-3-methyladenine glycosylase II